MDFPFGIKLADLALKGQVFNDYANVSDSIKDAVYAVINKVTDTYTQTGSASKAMLAGAVFGKSTYVMKGQSSAYKSVGRYDRNTFYWDNFMQDITSNRNALL